MRSRASIATFWLWKGGPEFESRQSKGISLNKIWPPDAIKLKKQQQKKQSVKDKGRKRGQEIEERKRGYFRWIKKDDRIWLCKMTE